MNIIGDVSGRKCLLVDDIVDSAGTLCNAAAALMENGASSVSAYVTHGVLSGIATDRVNNSVMEKLLITDSIQPSEEVINSDKFSVITIAPLIGEAMLRTTEERSVSSLFD
jgi:ribose-phosphate pyrophosphokinase